MSQRTKILKMVLDYFDRPKTSEAKIVTDAFKPATLSTRTSKDGLYRSNTSPQMGVSLAKLKKQLDNVFHSLMLEINF